LLFERYSAAVPQSTSQEELFGPATFWSVVVFTAELEHAARQMPASSLPRIHGTEDDLANIMTDFDSSTKRAGSSSRFPDRCRGVPALHHDRAVSGEQEKRTHICTSVGHARNCALARQFASKFSRCAFRLTEKQNSRKYGGCGMGKGAKRFMSVRRFTICGIAICNRIAPTTKGAQVVVSAQVENLRNKQLKSALRSGPFMSAETRSAL